MTMQVVPLLFLPSMDKERERACPSSVLPERTMLHRIHDTADVVGVVAALVVVVVVVVVVV